MSHCDEIQHPQQDQIEDWNSYNLQQLEPSSTQNQDQSRAFEQFMNLQQSPDGFSECEQFQQLLNQAELAAPVPTYPSVAYPIVSTPFSGVSSASTTPTLTSASTSASTTPSLTPTITAIIPEGFVSNACVPPVQSIHGASQPVRGKVARPYYDYLDADMSHDQYSAHYHPATNFIPDSTTFDFRYPLSSQQRETVTESTTCVVETTEDAGDVQIESDDDETSPIMDDFDNDLMNAYNLLRSPGTVPVTTSEPSEKRRVQKVKVSLPEVSHIPLQAELGTPTSSSQHVPLRIEPVSLSTTASSSSLGKRSDPFPENESTISLPSLYPHAFTDSETPQRSTQMVMRKRQKVVTRELICRLPPLDSNVTEGICGFSITHSNSTQIREHVELHSNAIHVPGSRRKPGETPKTFRCTWQEHGTSGFCYQHSSKSFPYIRYLTRHWNDHFGNKLYEAYCPVPNCEWGLVRADSSRVKRHLEKEHPEYSHPEYSFPAFSS